MKQSDISNELKKILKTWSEGQEFRDCSNLLAVIQFGSTCRGFIKKQTDLDLLFIYKKLPEESFHKYKETDSLLEKLDIDLKGLGDYDVSICSSPVVKEVSSLGQLSFIYLDMIEFSFIWYDPQDVAKSLIKNTEKWMKKHGSKKIQKGSDWYWILDTKSPKGSPIDLTLP